MHFKNKKMRSRVLDINESLQFDELVDSYSGLSQDSKDAIKTDTNFVHCSTTRVRWYVLFVFCFYVMQQYFIWNTFGPISSSVKKAFEWQNGDIALLANWDTIIYFLLCMQWSWLIQKIGFRKCFLLSLAFVMMGGSLRCIDSPAIKWTMNVGQILNGLGGMMAQTSGPILTSAWFPPNERTRATTISSLSCPLGVSLSFIVGPLIIYDRSLDAHLQPDTLTNTSKWNTTMKNAHGNHMKTTRDEIKVDFFKLMYAELIISVLTFLIALVYFPDKPTRPPSYSASLPKVKFTKAVRQLVVMKDFWIILIIGSSITGVYSGWYSMLALNFQDNRLPLTQVDCGWIGFGATIVSVFGGVAVGCISDRFGGHIKLILFVLYGVAALMFAWIILICAKLIPFNYGSVYTSCLISGFCINGSVPLIYEIMLETTYPASEAVSLGCLGLLNNVFTFLFLSILNIKNIGVAWMNWCLLLVCCMTLILLAIFKEKYVRTHFDSVGKSRSTSVNKTSSTSTEETFSTSLEDALSTRTVDMPSTSLKEKLPIIVQQTVKISN